MFGRDSILTSEGPEDIMDHFIKKRIGEDNEGLSETSKPVLAYIEKA